MKSSVEQRAKELVTELVSRLAPEELRALALAGAEHRLAEALRLQSEIGAIQARSKALNLPPSTEDCRAVLRIMSEMQPLCTSLDEEKTIEEVRRPLRRIVAREERDEKIAAVFRGVSLASPSTVSVRSLKFAAMAAGLILLFIHPHTHAGASAARISLAMIELVLGFYFLIGTLASGWAIQASELPRARKNGLLAALGAAFLVGYWAVHASPFRSWFFGGLTLGVGLGGGLLVIDMARMLLDAWRTRPSVSPGSRLLGVLGIVYSKKTMNLVFKPLLGDIQEEWQEHRDAGHVWSARMTLLRGCVQVVQTIAKNGGWTLVKVVLQIVEIARK